MPVRRFAPQVAGFASVTIETSAEPSREALSASLTPVMQASIACINCMPSKPKALVLSRFGFPPPNFLRSPQQGGFWA